MYSIAWNWKGTNERFQTLHKECANEVYTALKNVSGVENLRGELLVMDVSFDFGGRVYTYLTDFVGGGDDKVFVPTPDGTELALVIKCRWVSPKNLPLPMSRYKKTIRLATDEDFPL